jgi:hypothetical protein
MIFKYKKKKNLILIKIDLNNINHLLMINLVYQIITINKVLLEDEIYTYTYTYTYIYIYIIFI